jgi:(heptosyl)LPS beta-1,4-glucosyltransferase
VEPVSVTIITRNEEEMIAGAIASVTWADEVLVLDCGSDDRTVALAADAGARTVVEPWQGYGAQKNRAAELAANRWVLSLDADERCDARLARAVAELANNPGHAAFQVRRRNYFAGQPIRHWPWAWDTTARLYDRNRARFSENLVHEHLLCSTRIGLLEGTLEHLTYSDWTDYRERQQQYACLGAEQARQNGRKPRPGDLSLGPLATFVRHWLGRGYLLGGRLGWRLSLMAARGTLLKYRLLREQARRRG